MVNRKYYKLALTSIIIFLLFLFYNEYNTYVNNSKIVPKNFDIIKNRVKFKNHIFTKWNTEKSKYKSLSIEEKCNKYLKSISNINLKFWDNSKIDPLVYNKRKWIKKRKRELQRKIKKKNWTPEIDQQILNEFMSKNIEYSKLEEKMFKEVNDMKIGGKCLEQNPKNLKKLYPWSKTTPKFESRGIVIPILKSPQNVIRLVRALRSIENTLPIEVSHTSLSSQDQELIIDAAKNSTLPNIQDLTFIDLSSLPKNDSTFITIASLTYSKFEEVILLSENIIPLKKPELLFKGERYKSTGNHLFKSPSYLKDRVNIFPPGFHEITNFIKSFRPNKDDETFFDLKRGESYITSRFYEDHFLTMIDPNMIVINRKKSFNGLLIALNLQFYDIMKIRFTQGFDLDFLWIGLEISGQTLSFNYNYPVMAGIYTPQENLHEDIRPSQEICSASYAQLSDEDDISLISVTSHQLQNWLKHNHSFKTIFKDKYITKIKETKKIFNNEENTLIKNDYHTLHKIYQNPLILENIIRPPVLTQKVNVLNFNGPYDAWMEQKLTSENLKKSSHSYFCCYNVIGNALKDGKSGSTVNINEELQEKYKNIIDSWLAT
ncbi:uncharacterized protein KGF55_003288 [Candida pseudojiufengensis]|uniref:uncharacterized protein n=1 Tax=Candida pseudojiufengensis TaxID=497109 RepID=UPI0022243482|nr:uncharacterized protein KGF55_003288 [Candida pseudojiufengensis]KAI5962212.1 hypothetical protein KGF55_003288 [Candida pseudojiufengensis]